MRKGLSKVRKGESPLSSGLCSRGVPSIPKNGEGFRKIFRSLGRGLVGGFSPSEGKAAFSRRRSSGSGISTKECFARAKRSSGRGAFVVVSEGSLYFTGLRSPRSMKMIRLALFFAAGMYLGVNAENLGGLQTVAQTIGDVIEQFRHLR